MFGQTSSPFSNNGIQPSKIQSQTPSVPLNSDKNIQNFNNFYASIPLNTGLQTLEKALETSNNKQVPLTRPVDYFPNTNFGVFDPLSQKATSNPQGNSNLFNQLNYQNGNNNIDRKNFPNTGF
jgi:hypothetical protein